MHVYARIFVSESKAAAKQQQRSCKAAVQYNSSKAVVNWGRDLRLLLLYCCFTAALLLQYLRPQVTSRPLLIKELVYSYILYYMCRSKADPHTTCRALSHTHSLTHTHIQKYHTHARHTHIHTHTHTTHTHTQPMMSVCWRMLTYAGVQYARSEMVDDEWRWARCCSS